ncbi:MAG: MobA/MobL family protein [Lachnospiraceae bacterium]|nr:MobA/MobL family protein [Lachnospiraceae bacterium]
MQRNSFIQMSKLSNVRGRITYISSHAKQENLYAVYETTERSFWKELALCNQHEFQKSGTEGKCVEARELIIALPEDLVKYEPEYVLEQFTRYFKMKYGVECISALHHNKTKTNYHIHLIFSERKLLDEPIIKTAARSMFYDESGKRVRTKKEILDENGNVRKKCRVIKKGEIYEKMLFTVKDKRFKQEGFLEEVKKDFTAFINTFVFDEKKKLAVFDRHSPYLATKKIGKNNPRAEQIKTDNWARTEWNRTVDRALVEGISREEVLQVKREEITGKVQESVHRWGNRPWFFFSIVTHAIDVLSAMIKKIREQFQRMVALFETDGKNTAPVENLKSVAMVEPFVQGTEEVSVPAEADIAITSPKPELEPESKEEMTKLPEIILSPEIKGMDVSDSIATPKENESSSLKSQKDSIPPRPEFSMGMEKYDRLQEIYKKLVRQENIVLICEKELKQLRKELLLCTGVFQGKPRKELQRQITVKKQQMADAKQRLGDIVRGYGYLSVDNFMGMYRKTETDYADYTKRLKEWGDKYGMRYIKQQFEENIKSYPHPQKSKNSR